MNISIDIAKLPQRLTSGQKEGIANSSAEGVSNGRSVSHCGDQPCRLTVYLDDFYGHAFVGLENKARGVDIKRGFYAAPLNCAPDDGVCVMKGLSAIFQTYYADLPIYFWGAKLSFHHAYTAATASMIGKNTVLVFKKLPGEVEDEVESYKDFGGIKNVPNITFPISFEEAVEVETYLLQYADACKERLDSCHYRVLGANCVDFAQSVFSKTSYGGHFIDYFPSKMPVSVHDQARLYAAVSNLSYPAATVSFAGSVMLAATVGYWVTKKLPSAIKSLASWAGNLIWQSSPVKAIDENSVKDLHESLKASVADHRAIDQARAADQSVTQSRQWIHDSVELQFRLIEIETVLKREGYAGSSQAWVFEELQDLQRKFKVLNAKV